MGRLGRAVRRRDLGLGPHVEGIRDRHTEAVARARGSWDLEGRVLVVVHHSRPGEVEDDRIGPAAGDSSLAEGGCRIPVVAEDRGVDRGTLVGEDGRMEGILALLVI